MNKDNNKPSTMDSFMFSTSPQFYSIVRSPSGMAKPIRKKLALKQAFIIFDTYLETE